MFIYVSIKMIKALQKKDKRYKSVLKGNILSPSSYQKILHNFSALKIF